VPRRIFKSVKALSSRRLAAALHFAYDCINSVSPVAGLGASRVVSGTLSPHANSGKPVKVNIAVPAYGSLYASVFVRSFYSLLTSSARQGIGYSFSEADYADIETARNYLLSNFFYNKLDCEYILFIDTDMGFPPSLVSEMIGIGEDVVGVIAPRRSLNLSRLHSLGSEPYEIAYSRSCEFIGKPGACHPRNPSFAEVISCGAGILLISRKCIAKMISALPGEVDCRRFKKLSFGGKFPSLLTFFDKIELEDRVLSEDISFCYRWRDLLGGKIFASIGHEIEHVGSLVVRGKYISQEL
jgi:hypothetical protein